MPVLLMRGSDRDRPDHDERHLPAIGLRQGDRPALQCADQVIVRTDDGHRKFGNERHAFPDTIGGPAMAIGPEGRVQQGFHELRRDGIQRDNIRHDLPIRDLWRMGQRRKRGL